MIRALSLSSTNLPTIRVSRGSSRAARVALPAPAHQRAMAAAAPISKEALERHLAEVGDNKPKRVYFFHAHPCFALEPDSIELALNFRQKIQDAWKHDDRVEVHTFLAKKHSLFQSSGNFEVLFTRDAYTDVVTWLEFNRPEELSILVHPLTDAVVADHTSRALWMGKPVDLELSGLRKAQADWADKQDGMDEVDIVMKVHRVQAFPEDILRE